jgi:methylmalonyl-CoA mutase cobalamin-binding subunit
MDHIDEDGTVNLEALAKSMSVEQIIEYLQERGVKDVGMVNGGIYPVGIRIGNITSYIPALQS